MQTMFPLEKFQNYACMERGEWVTNKHITEPNKQQRGGEL